MQFSILEYPKRTVKRLMGSTFMTAAAESPSQREIATVAVLRGISRRPGVRLRTPIDTLRPIPPARDPSPELIDQLYTLIDRSAGAANVLRRGDRVLVKPNFNSGDPPPNSTDIALLIALVRLLRDFGASNVVVGESSRHPPTSTRSELRRAGVFDACARAGAGVEIFGESGWAPVSTRGTRLRWVEVARPLLECDRLIYLCCLKTHWLTSFSISLKHSVGCIRPRHRARMHFGGPIEEHVAEIASAFQPDLCLVDGRQCYIRGGPCYGFIRDAGVMLAGVDRVALDVTGVRCLQAVPGCKLSGDPWAFDQIRFAARFGLGVDTDAGIRSVELRGGGA
jgi:uncharacterized protein (DUF362 family)